MVSGAALLPKHQPDRQKYRRNAAANDAGGKPKITFHA